MTSALVDEEVPWAWKGDPNPALAIAGHSHRNAYRAAIREGLLPLGLRAATLEPPKPGIDPDSAYWQTASRVAAEALVLVWTGNQHNRYFMFAANPPIRLHDSGDADGAYVPAAMISARWAPTIEGLGIVVPKSIAQHVVVVGTPPPKSEAAIRSGLSREPVLVTQIEASGHDIEGVPVTPGLVRISLWNVLQEDLRTRAESLGATFVGVPARVRAADGYLKTDYSSEDASHANAAFGAVMIDEVLKALEAKRAGTHPDE